MALYWSGFSGSKFRRDGETEPVPRRRTRMSGENERKYCAMPDKIKVLLPVETGQQLRGGNEALLI